MATVPVSSCWIVWKAGPSGRASVKRGLARTVRQGRGDGGVGKDRRLHCAAVGTGVSREVDEKRLPRRRAAPSTAFVHRDGSRSSTSPSSASVKTTKARPRSTHALAATANPYPSARPTAARRKPASCEKAPTVSGTTHGVSSAVSPAPAARRRKPARLSPPPPRIRLRPGGSPPAGSSASWRRVRWRGWARGGRPARSLSGTRGRP